MENKESEKKPPKKRADKYDDKVKFEGTLEQMIKMSVNTKPKSNK